jgi:uncharacterized membrane protein
MDRFLTLLTVATAVVVAVWALVDWDSSSGPYLLAGSACYLLGTIGLTVTYHVPRNNARPPDRVMMVASVRPLRPKEGS